MGDNWTFVVGIVAVSLCVYWWRWDRKGRGKR